MRPNRAGLRTLMLTLFWALSTAAFCVTLAGGATDSGGSAVTWTRTLPYAGVWLAEMVALGLGYRYLGGLPRALWQPRLWLLAVFFAAVMTLGESFAQTGTAELVTGQKKLALLYFAGRVPAAYMGMALLSEALSRRRPAAGEPGAATAQGNGLVRPRPAWAIRAEQEALKVPAAPPPASGYAPPKPAWAAQNAPAVWTPEKQSIDPVPLATLGERTSAEAPEPAGLPEEREARYRCPAADTARGAWAPRADTSPTRAARPAATAKRREELSALALGLILMVCWLPYLFAVWPGTVSNDSITQLAEIFGVKALENGNPLAQTGLLWLAVRAGTGLFHSADAAVAIYVCVQAALMAWLLGYTLRRMAEARAPKWLTRLSFAFYAFCPIFPAFAFCVGKDTVFAMAVLWFSLMVWRITESKWPPFQTVLGLCLSAAACALLRNAGAVLAGVTLLALLIRSFTVLTRQWRAPVLALGSIAAALALLYAVVVPAVGAQAAAGTENWSVPLQQVARVAAGGELTGEEYAALDKVLEMDGIKQAYNGELSDPVKNLWRDTSSAEDKAAFAATWIRLGAKHPATYLSAFFHNSYGYLLPGYVSTIKPTFLMGMEGRTTQIDGLFDFTVNPAAETLKTALRSLFDYVPFRLLTAPGLYGWLALFALASVMGCRRRWNAIVTLPSLMTLAGCLFSAVNGYFRYAVPLYFAAPLLLALLSQALFSGRRGGRAKKPAA